MVNARISALFCCGVPLGYLAVKQTLIRDRNDFVRHCYDYTVRSPERYPTVTKS
jgi:hypothetical protein